MYDLLLGPDWGRAHIAAREELVSSEEQVRREEDIKDLAEDLELDKESADRIRGGEITQDVTVNKARTTDKNYKSMDEYIRG
jgi:hypothetical protein